tara:strand:+ start:79 stop:276 length:198 start_codon:yes stop_codon:yes gene_type:complete
VAESKVEKYAALVLPELVMYATSHADQLQSITGEPFTVQAARLAIEFAKDFVAELEKENSNEPAA